MKPEIVGEPLAVMAVCGDQQASMVAAGVRAGDTKVTYGTGSFIAQSLGDKFRIVEPFFTTLVPGRRHSVFALEAKITDCAKRVSAVLKEPTKLKLVLSCLAGQVDEYLKKLPIKPRRLIIDGGVTQSPFLSPIQRRISGVTVSRQKVADGTALGTAMLVRQALKMKIC